MSTPNGRPGTDRTRHRVRTVVLVALLLGGCGWYLANRDVDPRGDLAETPVAEVGGVGGGGPPPQLEGAGHAAASRGAPGRGASGPTRNVAQRALEGEIPASAYDVEWPSIRVVGPGGAIVRRAEVQLRERDEIETVRGEVRNGRVFLSRGPRPNSDLSGVEFEVTAPVAADPKLLLAPAHPTTFASGTSTFTVELRAASSIAGRVIGPDGGGVAGIRVAADVGGYAALDEWWTKTHGSVVTDGEGRFRLWALAARKYRLHPELTDEWVPEEWSTEVVATSPPAETMLRVRRARIVSVSVTVLDYENRPVSGALVGLKTIAAGWQNLEGRPGLPGAPASTDERGLATFAEVRLDAHTLVHVQPPIDRLDLRPGREEVSSERVTVRLPRAGLIRGFVRTASGSPVPAVRVAWVGENSERGSVEVGPDGSFVVGGLAADGSVELTALWRIVGNEGEPGAQSHGPSIRAQAGDRDVLLRFDAGVEMRFVLATPEDLAIANPWLDIYRVLPADGWFRRMVRFDESGRCVARHLVPGAQYAILRRPRLPGVVPLFETFVARDGDVIALRPRTPLRLSGRVFGGAESANPSGKRVVALAPEGTPLDLVSLRPDGRFQFEGLPVLPARVVVLSSDAKSAADPFASVPVSRPDEVLELRLP